MDMDPKNTSDYVPVIAQIKRKLVRRAYKPKTTIVKTKWGKCDLPVNNHGWCSSSSPELH
jgi:hypothetical protein